MKKIIILIVIVIALFCACRKPVIYSDIPEIKLISFEKYQDEVIQNGALLVFSFQDGDGDIGLDGNETPSYNFFCDYYEKRNGVFEKVDSIERQDGTMEPFSLNARIPRLSKLPEESINGEISLKMFLKKSPYDTIQLKFYIMDRKLNKSNVETAMMIR